MLLPTMLLVCGLLVGLEGVKGQDLGCNQQCIVDPCTLASCPGAPGAKCSVACPCQAVWRLGDVIVTDRCPTNGGPWLLPLLTSFEPQRPSLPMQQALPPVSLSGPFAAQVLPPPGDVFPPLLTMGPGSLVPPIMVTTLLGGPPRAPPPKKATPTPAQGTAFLLVPVKAQNSAPKPSQPMTSQSMMPQGGMMTQSMGAGQPMTSGGGMMSQPMTSGGGMTSQPMMPPLVPQVVPIFVPVGRNPGGRRPRMNGGQRPMRGPGSGMTSQPAMMRPMQGMMGGQGSMSMMQGQGSMSMRRGQGSMSMRRRRPVMMPMTNNFD